MIYPKQLKKGDTIGLVCPSSPISEERKQSCIKLIEDMGYECKIAPNVTTNYGGYMAGNGKERATILNEMFADKEVDAIFCLRGGDGGSRAMEYLNIDTIKNNPKIFVGYSDITSLHIAINKYCGFVSFHGPMVSSNMLENFDEETFRSFFEAINAEEPYQFKNPKDSPIGVLKEGVAKGELIGGNLALLSSAMGTFYEPDTKDKLLFIEEVGETMSRIERFAYQLRNSGKLESCRGIILGQFTDCTNKEMPEYTELECFKDILNGIDIPVIYNVQSGHDYPMMTLPFGAQCTIDTNNLKLSFEKPIR